jgi:alanine racemase
MAAGVTPPPLPTHRPTWAEIDLEALAWNLGQVRGALGSVPVLAVVKADAYGHGAVEVARALEREGVDSFGVALPEEGVELRRAGVTRPILLLGGLAPTQAELVLEHDLTPAVFRADQVEALEAAAGRRGVRLSAHLKIDTGVGRLGVPAAEAAAFAAVLDRCPRVRLTGAFSHLAVADDPSDGFTARQIDLFLETVRTLRSRGLALETIHLANSAAVTDHRAARLTLARPGLVLYGYPPSGKVSTLPWRPVLSLKSTVIYLKEVEAGTSLGYGRTYVTARPARIASLAIGYDDGLPRLVGNRGYVLVRGRRAPIVGRISMDLTTIDVTEIPDARLGDVAVLIGRDGEEFLGADLLASWAETISWEVLCGVGARVPRVYRTRDGRSIPVSRFGVL